MSLKLTPAICGAVLTLTACGGEKTRAATVTVDITEQEIDAGIAAFQSGEGTYSAELLDFLDLKTGKFYANAVITDYLSPKGEGHHVFKAKTFDTSRASRHKYYLAKNMNDDAVKDMEIIGLWLAGANDGPRFAGASARVKCWRGQNTTDWQATPCP